MLRLLKRSRRGCEISLPVVILVMERLVDLKWLNVVWKAVTLADEDLDGIGTARI